MKRKIILFDGECNLCNKFIQFVINNDKKGEFKFGALQSSHIAGNTFVGDNNEYDSIFLIIGSQFYSHSEAVIEIFNILGGYWKFINFFKVLPKSMRDRLYLYVSRNRYFIFGKTDSCLLPSKDLQNRFLKETEIIL